MSIATDALSDEIQELRNRVAQLEASPTVPDPAVELAALEARIFALEGAQLELTGIDENNMTVNLGGVIMRPKPPSAFPTFTSIVPSSGAESDAVVITGTGFRSDTTLTFGGTAATAVVVQGSTIINCNVPAHASGAVDIVITNSDSKAVTATNAFTYTPAPTFTSVVPTSGDDGQAVVLTGTNFVATPAVTFGGTTATSIVFVSSTTINCNVPVHATGVVDIIITNPDTQSVTATSAFTYVTSSLPDFSTETADYEDRLEPEGNTRWVADAGQPAEERTYYDRSYAWYIFGKPSRGDSDQQAYLDEYIDPFDSPPRNWEPDGLMEHYQRSGDAALLTSLKKLGDQAVPFIDQFMLETGAQWEGRIQERGLLNFMCCDAMNISESSHDWSALADQVKDAIIASQHKDDEGLPDYANGMWSPPHSDYTSSNTGLQVSTNFMSCAAMSALTRYYEYYGTDLAAIQATVDLGCEWMWTTQWRESGDGFNYFSDNAVTGAPIPAPDLNMMMVDIFGWLYTKTNDTKWITRGDRIFQGALDSAFINAMKHYNQFVRSGWRYLYYRDGYDISHIDNPIEVNN